MKFAFWGLVVLDLLGILLLFVLGLAAAGSTKSNPLQVMMLLLVLPCVPLAGAVVLFTRSSSPVGRMVAFLLAASPLVILVSMRAIAEIEMRTTTNEDGEMTFYRSGPMRELAEAIGRNDAAAVAALLPKVDVNKAGLMGVTPLLLAARHFSDNPEHYEVLRLLLKAGADPNKSGQYEFPFALVIQVAGKSGLEPLKLMLDAGANPNVRDSFGGPIWFDALGVSSSLDAVGLLLDRGADINAVARSEATALVSAATMQNWKAVLFLLQRGADWKLGKSVNGMPFQYMVEGEIGSQGGDSTYQAVRRALQQANK